MRRTLSTVAVVVWVWTLISAAPGPLVAEAPANDRCSGAVVIPGNGPFPYLTAVVPDISGATSDGDPSSECVYESITNTHSIWYRFAPVIGGTYTISCATDTETTVFDTVLTVYGSIGGGCNGIFVELGCNDEEAGPKSALQVPLEAGATYYIVFSVGLYGFDSGNTAVQVRVSLPVESDHDFCGGAEVIPSEGPFPHATAIADMTLATTAADPPTPSCGSGFTRSVWYRFAPAQTAIYEFSTCEETATTVLDTTMAIYAAPALCQGPLPEVGCSSAGCGSRGRFSARLEAGTTYYLVVWDEGELTLGETSLQVRVKQFHPPTVTTLAPSGVTSGSAVLNGSINPNGLATAAWFEYGPTTNYGFATPPQPLVTGEQPLPASILVSVFPGSAYHYRTVATNTMGITVGSDQVFEWNSTPPVMLACARLTNGQARVEFLATPGQVYGIEATLDLSVWDLLGPAQEDQGGSFRFVDTAAASLPRRFYRAVGF